MNYLFDFDGTLITELDINYSKLKNELAVILGVDKKITPMIEKIYEYAKNDLSAIQYCFNLINLYELRALLTSKIKEKVMNLYLSASPKIIVSRNGFKVIDKFFRMHNLPYPDYISCRDNNTYLKPSIKQLDFVPLMFPELERNKEMLTLIGDSDIDLQLANNYKISFINVKSIT
jgi:phosphoglycolate phosphatase-like HAD superfamily hydrolase